MGFFDQGTKQLPISSQTKSRTGDAGYQKSASDLLNLIRQRQNVDSTTSTNDILNQLSNLDSTTLTSNLNNQRQNQRSTTSSTSTTNNNRVWGYQDESLLEGLEELLNRASRPIGPGASESEVLDIFMQDLRGLQGLTSQEGYVDAIGRPITDSYYDQLNQTAHLQSAAGYGGLTEGYQTRADQILARELGDAYFRNRLAISDAIGSTGSSIANLEDRILNRPIDQFTRVAAGAATAPFTRRDDTTSTTSSSSTTNTVTDLVSESLGLSRTNTLSDLLSSRQTDSRTNTLSDILTANRQMNLQERLSDSLRESEGETKGHQTIQTPSKAKTAVDAFTGIEKVLDFFF